MACVTTRTATLSVYEQPNLKSNMIGTLDNGTYLTITETKIIESVMWGRFSCDGFTNAWVIVKHPSVNYYYINLNQDATAGSIMASVSRGTAKLITNQSSTSAQYTSVTTEVQGGIVKTVDSTKTTTEYTRNLTLDVARQNPKASGTSTPSAMPPDIIQNDMGYPLLKGYNSVKHRYEYDYATDYSDTITMSNLEKVRNSVNIYNADPSTLFRWNSEKYNRFKIQNPNEILPKTFSHVFFTRPDCSILNYQGNGVSTLHQNVEGSPLYNLRYKNSKELLYSLVTNCGWDHEFMMYLSNRVIGFELKDRSLETDTYGKTLRGNSIIYGRNTEKSKAAGEVSITFAEDVQLHTLQLHELWLDYIDGVSKGRYTPDNTYIMNKSLDYASSAYYILCGPDGETVLYIAKFYGIFPTTVPDSILSWQRNSTVTNPEISISYGYSWMEIDNPSLIVDFNSHINYGTYTYERSYQPDILSTGTTWVGAPFIESRSENGNTVYKLRFCHK